MTASLASPVRVAVAAAMCLISMFVLSATAHAQDTDPVPIIFVHGNSGSAQQFETDAMRFTSNGFPQDRLYAYEYDSLASNNDAAIAGLDPFIANVKADTGASQVDILAHSRGTLVMHTYLASSPERAASVRRYVNFDGRTNTAQPGGVPTLAIWGEGDQTRTIGGAENVYFPNRAHTEVTTSAASFVKVYEFLLGSEPETKAVIPENPKKVRVSGRALDFPTNAGMAGSSLQVFALDETGHRASSKPVYKKTITADGNFGPLKVDGRKHYEFAITGEFSAGSGITTIHNYPEPFERSDHFYRILNAPLLAPSIERSPNHTSIAVTRMREFWGDQTFEGGTDRLEFNGFNVINPAIAPRVRRVLAVFNFDKNSDKKSDTSASLAPFGSIGFLTGVDNYMASSPNGKGTIDVEATMRGNQGHAETISVPNWPSDTHTVSVFFRDYKAKEFKKKKGKG